jgi:butyryl-CoA dehydrogenase
MCRYLHLVVAADFIAVLCRTGERQTFLFADMHAPGITVGDPDRKMGNYVQRTADVTFDQVFVLADHIIGAFGSGLRAALGALMLGRMGIGAIGVAMAQAAFDFSSDYIIGRKVVGSELGVVVARDAIQCCGANEVQRWVIARRIFGREITG